MSATHFIPNIVTNIRYQHRCWFSHWCIIFWDRSKFRKLVFRLVYWKSRVCLRPVFVMQFEKVIHARFVPYKSNLSQIYFFPNSRSKVPFSSALILFKLRKYQFFRNTGSLLQGIWFNIGFPKLNGWIFQKTTFLKIFEDLKRRFMSKIGILGYIQLEERFEITPYSRVPNCGIFGNRSRL